MSTRVTNRTQSQLPDQGPTSEVIVKARTFVAGDVKPTPRLESPFQEGELTEQELTRYLSEVFGGATSLSIRVKDSARSQLRPLARLPELHRLLLEKHVWGAQIRYSLKDAEWTYTLIVTHSGAQVVRVCH